MDASTLPAIEARVNELIRSRRAMTPKLLDQADPELAIVCFGVVVVVVGGAAASIQTSTFYYDNPSSPGALARIAVCDMSGV